MQLMNVSLRHIRAFVTVAETQSFARAAEALHISQPALSQTIIQLEDAFGLRLFDRTTRHVELTPIGATLLPEARAVLGQMRTLLDLVETHSDRTRKALRVGYLIGTGVDLVPQIVRAFRETHPQVEIEFIEYDFSTPDAGLSDGSVDLAVYRPPVAPMPARTVVLMQEPCVVSLPDGHELASRETVSIRDILHLPIVAAPGTGLWRDYWLACRYRDGVPPTVSHEAATVDAELQAVATGRGISITAESTARFYARPGVTFRVIHDMPKCEIAIGSVERPRSIAREFIAIAEKVVGGGASAKAQSTATQLSEPPLRSFAHQAR